MENGQNFYLFKICRIIHVNMFKLNINAAKNWLDEKVKCYLILQISQLEKKLEQLRVEKHELFSQLKKVLHQEDETRKRTQLKEQR